MRWAELILQDSEKSSTFDISYDPDTQRQTYLWKTGMTFRMRDGVSIQSLEVVIEPGKPGREDAPVDNEPLGLLTAFCRGGDQNGSILAKCPEENMPGPFARRESDAYDWSDG